MYILNFASTVKKMSVNEIRYLIFENYCKRVGFSKENSHCSINCFKKKRFIVACKKVNKKMPDPCNTKEHYQPFLREKSTKSVKQ